MAARNAHRILRFGESRGLAPRGEARTLPDAACPTARVPVQAMYALWAQLGRARGAPDLPFEIARQARLEDLDVLGFVLVTAPTVLEALEAFVRYGALLNENGSWQVRLERRTVALRWCSAPPRSLGERLSHEAALSLSVRGVRQLCDAAVDPLRVGFRHRAPARALAHHEFFRSELSFGGGVAEVVFAREVCDAVPPGANPALFRYLKGQADAQLAQLRPRSLGARVEDELARILLDGAAPDMTVVAQNLAIGERTLRRALKAEGLSYRGLLDEVRRARALELLASPAGSVTEAALATGFSDTSAFSHACRRWFKRPPSALRAGAASSAPALLCSEAHSSL